MMKHVYVKYGFKMMFLWVLITLIGSVYAQKKEDSLFKSGDKIAFIGNSITHNGDFHHYILLYYASRFPDKKVTFYNLGIKGDNANSFLRRMDADIVPHKADWSIVMAGMNDVNRGLYAPEKQNEPDIQQRKERALKDFESYYDSFLTRLKRTKTNIILQKPSIYDQTGDLTAVNLVGVNDALERCGKIVDKLAKKHKVLVIDYWTIMNEVNANLQQTDVKSTIVGQDRVHPGPLGHFVMAYTFLKAMDTPNNVSSLTIDKGSITDVKYGTVSNLNMLEDELTFDYREERLPFPVPPEAEKALTLIPFTDDFNTQLLQVKDLEEGVYALTIDDILISNFTQEELAKGINLAERKNTPPYQQALKVLKEAVAYRNVQRQLREIKFVEFSYLPKELWGGDLEPIKTFISEYLSFLQVSKDARYETFHSLFETYLKNKPHQTDLEKQAKALPETIYQFNQPQSHRFRLVKADLNMPDRNEAPFGVNLAGAEFAHQKTPGVYNRDYTYPTIAELDYFKSKGLTLFRLPFLWERLQHELDGPLDEAELARMTAFVDAARERNLWVILDMHNYGRRFVNGTREIIGSANLPIKHFADVWGKLAERFRTKENIWAYGLMNEPHGMLDSVPWFTIAQRAIFKIREMDTNTPIMVGGDSWSSTYRWQQASGKLKDLVDPSTNLIFEGHLYFDKDASGTYKGTYDEEGTTPETGIVRARPFVEWLKENNLKGFVGEYGVPDDDPRWLVTLDNMLNYLKDNGVNGTYWAAGPWWNTYKLAIEPRDGIDRPQLKVLLKYLKVNEK
ncbi:cellulase family glycosylhydrolase [Sphingobacterium sp. SGR-19]|uniref:cellulase family glycosylhydrolase n=1 Tax=Sphingobacterium sp. SGR-19 TaxID=2710886 RepID=UPI0013EA0B8A|nr:cellulase family glycosylhydrolase [Sphingobacterium sp. SGR-19]NGM65951.1 cellulase family glycosylhydrolase [Sphingobacterium sp. SGR-19]